jgi:phage shock protein A
MGRAELAGDSVEGRMLEIQKSTLDMAGSSRLEQIRASMAGEKLAGPPTQPAVDKAASTADTAGVARLDELRASMAKDKKTGDTSAAG